MMLPGERALRDEREAIAETMRSLDDEQFSSAATLCEGWAPRDILVHLMGVDQSFGQYFRAGGWINTANEVIVAKSRGLDRDELMARMEAWLASPAPWTRLGGAWLLGDNAMHHQDVLRPLGRSRDIPEASANAMLRTGTLFGARKLLHYRAESTDGGMTVGRGQTVRGTREALALWLAGRQGIESELEFAGEQAA